MTYVKSSSTGEHASDSFLLYIYSFQPVFQSKWLSPDDSTLVEFSFFNLIWIFSFVKCSYKCFTFFQGVCVCLLSLLI